MALFEAELERKLKRWRMLAVISIVVNLVLAGWLLFAGRSRPPAEPEVAPVVPAEPAAPAPAAPGAEQAAPAVPQPPEAAPPTPAPTAPAEPPSAPANVKTFCARLDGPLVQAFAASMDQQEADWLAAHVQRLMMWEMDLRRDLARGDLLRVAYEWDGTIEGIHIVAMDYQGIEGRRLRAVRYLPQGDRFPSYFDPRGREIQLRLDPAPLKEFEQVTELMNRGGRRHQGVDFKAPLGTDVFSPFDGTVTRVNWNWRFNGNCVEIYFSSQGFHGIFMHMEKFEPWVKPGAAVKAGQKIGTVGNTGRTNAPHLHYQIEVAEKPVDPYTKHKTYRRELPADEMPRFEQAVKPLWERVDQIPCDSAPATGG